MVQVVSLVSWTVLRDRFREETSCSSRWTGLEEGLRSRASSWGQGLVSPECSKNQEKSHHDCSTEDTFFNTTRCPKKKCELLLLLQVVIHTFFLGHLVLFHVHQRSSDFKPKSSSTILVWCHPTFDPERWVPNNSGHLGLRPLAGPHL